MNPADAAYLEHVISLVALGRLGHADEIAAVGRFAACPQRCQRFQATATWAVCSTAGLSSGVMHSIRINTPNNSV
jgi:hypothetical protein